MYRVFPLAESAAALRHLLDGHPTGKVVVRVGDQGDVSAAARTPLA